MGRKTVFDEARQLAGDERESFVRDRCANDPAMAADVLDLLKHFDDAGDFLIAAPPGLPVPATPACEGPGATLGRYKLLELIGEGAFGSVFRADQQEPVRRTVAIKVIKPGMDTRQVIARFEQERQALALMDHPGIAKVLDAGMTEAGRPYFVMELVRGEPITCYCDNHRIDVRERLRIFMQVCHAVQHAHQKGIIHRDIKPSNVLVTTTSEGTALPVVIDFGIAKPSANQRLTEKTLFTAFEMFIGTPAYISPEQAALTSVDVDTRTDIYSLGVLLYELLTGSKPFDAPELLKSGIDEIRRVIREQEPARPSTRLSKMNNAELTTVAQRRRSDAPKLIRMIRGDLDWIVMKAMEKDRSRRYETANGLALDVRRHLASEAISARPPSAAYRFQKTVQRNRLLFAGMGVIAVLLLGSLIVLSALLSRERQARQQSQQVTAILEEMFNGVGVSRARGRNIEMLRDILDRTAGAVKSDTRNAPAVQARLCHLVAKAYLDIGLYDQAAEMVRIALGKERELYGSNSIEAAASLHLLGVALFASDAELPEAESALREALVIRERLLGPTNGDVAASLDALGSVYADQRRLTEASPMIRRGLEIRRQLFPGNNLPVAESLQSLCRLLEADDRWPEAEAVAREFLEMSKQIPGREDLVAEALDDLAMAAGFNGKLDVQEKLNKEAFAIKQGLLPENHPYLIKSMANLGEILRLRGETIEAHAVLAGVISIQRKILGETHNDTLASLGSFGQLLAAEGKWEEAEKIHREGLTLWRRRVGDTHPHALWAWGQLCHVMVQQRKYQEAEELLGEILTPAFAGEQASAPILGRRLDLMCRLGRWREAVIDAETLIHYQPGEYYWPYTLGAVLAMTHDRIGYESLCRGLPGAFARTRDPYVAQRIADTCLLLPNSGAEMLAVAELANRAVALGNHSGGSGYFEACKALSDYRENRFSDALAWAEKARSSPEVFARARGCAVAAMAQWRLGHPQEARAAWTEGERLIPKISPMNEGKGGLDLGNDWLNLLLARVQLDEANALVRTAAADGDGLR